MVHADSRVRVSIVRATLLVALASVALVGPSAAQITGPRGFWPMFRQNPQHTSRTSVVGPLRPALSWLVDLGGPSYSSPAIGADGSIFVGTQGRVVALHPDGSPRWTTPIDGTVISSPAIGDAGLIYLGSRDKNIYALDERTGEIRWTFTTRREVWSSAAVGPNGAVYVGSFDGSLYALDARTGTLRWEVFVGGDVASSPAIGADGTVYFGSSNGLLSAVSGAGQLRWQQEIALDGDIASSPALDGRTLFVGSFDGALYALDAQTGLPRWAFETGGAIISSPAVGTDGAVYFGSTDGNVYAVSSDGSERWRVEAGAAVISSPAIDASGTVYVGTQGGRLLAIAADGTLSWTWDAEHAIWASPVLDAQGGILFVTAGTEQLSGRLHRLTEAPFEVSFAPPPAQGASVTAFVSRPENFRPTAGTLFFRRGGEQDYQDVPLDMSGSSDLTAVIPAEAVSLRGVEYYVSLTDGVTTSTFPAFDPIGHPARLAVRVDEADAAINLEPRRYRAVSVPLVLEDASVTSALEDDFGPQGPTAWRLFAWGDQDWVEFPDVDASFVPGAAFFLVTQNGGSFGIDGGRSVSSAGPVAVRLQPGWNLVGNPFAFPVSVDDFEGDADRIEERAYFDGVEMIQSGPQTDALQPWEALFLRNASPGPITVLIPPIERESIGSDLPELRAGLATTNARLRLSLTAAHGGYRDTQNWIGFTAGPEPDRLVEAPRPPDAVHLAILDAGVGYARLLRPPDGDGASWEVEIDAPRALRGEALSLSVVPESPVSPDVSLRIVDAASGEVLADGDPTTAIQLNASEASRRLMLYLGSASFVEAATPAVRTFALDPGYPNPFTDRMTIAFTAPKDGHVSIDVFDALGRSVRVLTDAVWPEGRHEVEWDGMNDAGRSVASGTYFVRARAASAVVTRRVAYLR